MTSLRRECPRKNAKCLPPKKKNKLVNQFGGELSDSVAEFILDDDFDTLMAEIYDHRFQIDEILQAEQELSDHFIEKEAQDNLGPFDNHRFDVIMSGIDLIKRNNFQNIQTFNDFINLSRENTELAPFQQALMMNTVLEPPPVKEKTASRFGLGLGSGQETVLGENRADQLRTIRDFEKEEDRSEAFRIGNDIVEKIDSLSQKRILDEEINELQVWQKALNNIKEGKGEFKGEPINTLFPEIFKTLSDKVNDRIGELLLQQQFELAVDPGSSAVNKSLLRDLRNTTDRNSVKKTGKEIVMEINKVIEKSLPKDAIQILEAWKNATENIKNRTGEFERERIVPKFPQAFDNLLNFINEEIKKIKKTLSSEKSRRSRLKRKISRKSGKGLTDILSMLKEMRDTDSVDLFKKNFEDIMVNAIRIINNGSVNDAMDHIKELLTMIESMRKSAGRFEGEPFNANKVFPGDAFSLDSKMNNMSAALQKSLKCLENCPEKTGGELLPTERNLVDLIHQNPTIENFELIRNSIITSSTGVDQWLSDLFSASNGTGRFSIFDGGLGRPVNIDDPLVEEMWLELLDYVSDLPEEGVESGRGLSDEDKQSVNILHQNPTDENFSTMMKIVEVDSSNVRSWLEDLLNAFNGNGRFDLSGGGMGPAIETDKQNILAGWISLIDQINRLDDEINSEKIGGQLNNFDLQLLRNLRNEPNLVHFSLLLNTITEQLPVEFNFGDVARPFVELLDDWIDRIEDLMLSRGPFKGEFFDGESFSEELNQPIGEIFSDLMEQLDDKITEIFEQTGEPEREFEGRGLERKGGQLTPLQILLLKNLGSTHIEDVALALFERIRGMITEFIAQDETRKVINANHLRDWQRAIQNLKNSQGEFEEGFYNGSFKNIIEDLEVAILITIDDIEGVDGKEGELTGRGSAGTGGTLSTSMIYNFLNYLNYPIFPNFHLRVINDIDSIDDLEDLRDYEDLVNSKIDHPNFNLIGVFALNLIVLHRENLINEQFGDQTISTQIIPGSPKGNGVQEEEQVGLKGLHRKGISSEITAERSSHFNSIAESRESFDD